MRKLALCLTTITCTALTACGGATVDSDDVEVTETTEVTETATSTTAETSTTASAETSAAPASSASNGAGDEPAREVDSVPHQAPAYSPEEQAFLDHLSQNGVNVDGLEDQLTATGFTVCDNDTITRDAVAGQLVEQRRTDMGAAAVATLIGDTARANLCG